MEDQLSRRSPRDFFLDLRHAAKEWSTAGASRLETNGRMPTALSADFDGAVLLHRVSGAELDFLPGWLGASARAGGFIIAHPFVVAGIALASLYCLLRLSRRRRGNQVSYH